MSESEVPEAKVEARLVDAGLEVIQLLKPLLDSGQYLQYFDLWQENGFHVTRNHFYEPVPDTRLLTPEFWEKTSALYGIDMRVEEQLNLLTTVFPQYSDEYNNIPLEKTSVPYEYYFNNDQFSGTDALLLYCMVRHFKPPRIIEVGSGFSTLIAAQAARINGRTELICIEPYPRQFLSDGFPGLSKLIAEPVQGTDPETFLQLQENDILFIDTSHVVKTGNEVLFLYLDILPRLQPGVFVHIHDIFFPNEYPKSWLLEKRHFWNEQYLLQAFLIHNSAFEVIFSNSYMAHFYMENMQQAFPKSPRWGGGSFWMRRKLDV